MSKRMKVIMMAGFIATAILFPSCHNLVGPTSSDYHNKILFTSKRSGVQQLYMVNPDGRGTQELTTGPYWHAWGRWSPDTKRIVAMTGENSSTACPSEMVVFDVYGTNRRLLGCGAHVAWSPDGKKIAFSYMPRGEIGDLTTHIYVMDVDGTNPLQLTDNLGDIDDTPSWSPDGNRIYFGSNRNDPTKNNPEIYCVKSDGTELKQVTFTPNGYSTSPSISPDGKYMAFVSNRDSLTPAIFVMRLDTGGIRKVVRDPPGEVFNYPMWSPDGTMLVFVSGLTDGSTRTYIYTVNVDGTNLRKIIPDDDTAGLPDWSR